MSEVTILGMGAMGARMAMALLKAGHDLTVWNRTPERTLPLVALGAKVADTPRAAVQQAKFVISMVRDDAASAAVWLDPETGALAGLSTGTIAIESSTLTVAWTKDLAEHCRMHGNLFLDAPVAGSRPQAEAAQLIYLVGGASDAFTQAQPLLRAMGSTVHHIGPTGSGAAVKLVVNALLGIQVAAMGELIGFIEHCGLDAAQVIELIAATPVCSPLAKAAAGSMLAGNYTPLFPIELIAKDLGYIRDTAGVNGAKTPIAEAAQRVFAEGIAQGHGAENMTGIVQLYR